jgi:hypothetical protein
LFLSATAAAAVLAGVIAALRPDAAEATRTGPDAGAGAPGDDAKGDQ